MPDLNPNSNGTKNEDKDLSSNTKNELEDSGIQIGNFDGALQNAEPTEESHQEDHINSDLHSDAEIEESIDLSRHEPLDLSIEDTPKDEKFDKKPVLAEKPQENLTNKADNKSFIEFGKQLEKETTEALKLDEIKPSIEAAPKRNWKLIGAVGGLVTLMIAIGTLINLPSTDVAEDVTVGEQLTGNSAKKAAMKKKLSQSKKSSSKKKCKTIKKGGKSVEYCPGDSSSDSSSGESGSNEVDLGAAGQAQYTAVTPNPDASAASAKDEVDTILDSLIVSGNPSDAPVIGYDDSAIAGKKISNLANETIKDEAKVDEINLPPAPSSQSQLSSCGPDEKEGPIDPGTGQPTCIKAGTNGINTPASGNDSPKDQEKVPEKEEKKADKSIGYKESLDSIKKDLTIVESAEKAIKDYLGKAKAMEDKAQQAFKVIELQVTKARQNKDNQKAINSAFGDAKVAFSDLEKAKKSIEQYYSAAKKEIEKLEKAIQAASKELTKIGIGKTKTNAQKLITSAENKLKELKSQIKAISKINENVDKLYKNANSMVKEIDLLLTKIKKSGDKTLGSTGTATVNQQELVCNALKEKYKDYKAEIINPHLNGLEQSISQYILHYNVFLPSLEANCGILTSTEQKASTCSNKELFNTKSKSCRAIPGYLHNASSEVNCEELDEVMAAIASKENDPNLDSKDKSLLASFKLDLNSKESSCKQILAKQVEEQKKITHQSLQNKGGGGGGGTTKLKTDFEIDNLQIIPEEFNPFDEIVKVHFFITRDAFVSVEILDGAEVIREFESQKLNAGDRFFAWDGRKEDGGFVSEGDYEFKLIVKKATNKNSVLEEEGTLSVKYFDEQFETIDDQLTDFEDFDEFGEFEEGVTFTTGAAGFSSNDNSTGPKIASHGVASPLAQSIHLEGQGKTVTSETGPETILYLLFIPVLHIFWPYIGPHLTRKKVKKLIKETGIFDAPLF